MSQRRFDFPTAATVAVLINGYHVDLAYRIDWKESKPKIPLYNYNSDRYSRIAVGRGVVQGFLVTNFVHPGYLTEVLKIVKGGPILRLSGTGLVNEVDLKNPIAQEVLKQVDGITGLTPESREERVKVMASLLQSNKGKNRDAIIEILRNKQDFRPSSGQASIRKVLSPLHVSSNNNNTIELYYHDVKHVRWYTIFYDVEFSDVTQQITIAGSEGSSEPLYEVAEFISSFREANQIRIQNQ